jgi:D-alanyl-D-alanine carboxypeptidase
MKTKFFFLPFILLAVVLAPQPVFARYASIVVNETSGEVMYSRNADKQLYPASLTKVMTLYLLFESLEAGTVTMDTPMKVSRVAAGRSPSKLGLKAGSTIKVKNAMLALVTKSANDAATVIAEHLSGTERAFAKKMTRKAKALGMTRTNFRNASGLPHSQQKSTARDMARLAIAIRKDFPQYFHFFKTQRFDYRGKRHKNHNALLQDYQGTDGIKTGYIRASGFNLIATVERNGTRLVGVVFGGKTGNSRNAHMMQLLDKQFARLPLIKTPKERQIRVIPARSKPVSPPPRKPQEVEVYAAKTQNRATPKPILETDLPNLNDPNIATVSASQQWGIQVGSFSRRVNAHLAARNARQVASKFLDLQPAKLRQVAYGNLTLWQVHFQGLDEDKAREACVELVQSGLSCIAAPSPQV